MDLSARSIQLSNNGWVNTESTGTKTDAGVSGSITINATDTLRLDHGAIRTQTASANGGNVTLKVGHLFDLRASTVTTSVAGGTGSGGNIFSSTRA